MQQRDATIPCAWGLWRRTILLPAAADDWPLDHRRLALAHEWSHLRRGDPFWHMLSVFVLALHWANCPLDTTPTQTA
jgi:beta-lactamase regulating signal transducer with metallopeptidase domain